MNDIKARTLEYAQRVQDIAVEVMRLKEIENPTENETGLLKELTDELLNSLYPKDNKHILQEFEEYYNRLQAKHQHHLKDMETIKELTGRPIEELNEMDTIDLLELIEEVCKEIELTQSMRVDSHATHKQELTSHVTNTIFSAPVYDQTQEIITSKRKGASVVYLLELGAIEQDEKLSDIKINEFDKQVLMAVYSLAKSGEYQLKAGATFLPYSSIDKMISADFNSKPTEGRIKSIKESVKRLRNHDITLDLRREETILNPSKLSKFKKLNPTGLKITDHMLSARAIEYAEVNGSLTEGIVLHNIIPPLIMYCELKGHIRAVKLEDIKTPSVTNHAINRDIKNILINRIEVIKSTETVSRNITYANIYKQLSIDNEEIQLKIKELDKAEQTKARTKLRKDKQRIRDTISKILKDFTANGYIKGFTELPKNKGQAHGIKIKLVDEKPIPKYRIVKKILKSFSRPTPKNTSRHPEKHVTPPRKTRHALKKMDNADTLQTLG